jgi:hypothetical protein
MTKTGKRYTVLTYDGLGPYSPMPEAPADDNGAKTLADARALFKRWLRDSGNDYTRAEGYGQPWADVVLTESWDGISYGDVTGGDGVCRFERGTRGGIVRLNF